ncbi:MAG: hypothetical protein IJ588_01575 [Prevotella sp.]|nr:hypothetical protein [Prevotella sp.]
MDNEVKFGFEDAPTRWAVCFNGECRAAAECLRHLAATLAPKETTQTMCVTPLAEGYGERCELFWQRRVERVAYGFAHFYDVVLKDDYTSIRKQLTSYFHGPRQYYWYLKGERGLTEEQQRYVRGVFADRGYTDLPDFERYENRYVVRSL